MPFRVLSLAVTVSLIVCLAAQAQEKINPGPSEPDFKLVVPGHFDAETLAEIQEAASGLVLQIDSATLSTIMEDGPGEFDVDVNEAYPKERPLATMPPKLLLQLPELPRMSSKPTRGMLGTFNKPA